MEIMKCPLGQNNFEIIIHSTGSKGNCYSIIDGNHKLLIEAGLTIKEIMKATGFRLNDYDGCLISHEHRDHARSVNDLIRMGIDCYMTLGTLLALDCSNSDIEKGDEIFIKDRWIIEAFPLIHDALDPCGFLILTPSRKKVLYISDTRLIINRFTGITHYMIECNFIRQLIDENQDLPEKVVRRIIDNHFEFEYVKKFFKEQDLTLTEKIYLIHLSEANSNEKIMIDTIQAITGKPVYVS